MQTTTRFLILFITALVLQSASCKNIKELDYKGIQDTQWQALGLKNASILINLKYYNPNSFGIDVKESNLSIYLNDRFLAVADQPSKTQIPRESEFLFPVVAHFDPLKALGAAFTSLLNKKNKLTIQGSAKVGKGGVYLRVPINITEEVSLFNK